jgi:hypothetical protein
MEHLVAGEVSQFHDMDLWLYLRRRALAMIPPHVRGRDVLTVIGDPQLEMGEGVYLDYPIQSDTKNREHLEKAFNTPPILFIFEHSTGDYLYGKIRIDLLFEEVL